MFPDANFVFLAVARASQHPSPDEARLQKVCEAGK